MTKQIKKVIALLIALTCSVCLAIGISACNNEGNKHEHTYATEWSKDESGHWHAATCEHTDEVKDFAEHSYEDGECTECGFKDPDYQEPHEHTFSDVWLHDEGNGHYRLATCHDGVKSELEAHVDEDKNEICDVCEYDMHVHTYAEEWSYDEANHWHAATCTHTFTKDEAEHNFVDGVCECGVTEDEVAVYEIYKEAEGAGAYSFAIWLESLKNEGVTEIKIAASGDALYYYGDTYEVAYFVERTVTVTATADGAPLAHVWFSVQLQANKNTTLAAAETDENGKAIITFVPTQYSDDNNSYVLRIPEGMNIPDNGDGSILPIPRKYTTTSRSRTLEIDENVMENTSFSFIFALSNDWSDDVRKDVHPYDRTYADLGDNTSEIIEHGKEWTIEKTTGNGYMDYFNFEPYSLFDSTSGDQATKIANAKKAAMGNYKLSFTTTGDAKVYLVYWNYNFSIGGFKKNADNSPADEYVSSISGIAPEGSEISKKYTGENYVIVRISEEMAASTYHLGLYTSESCSVTISVERIGDYEEEQEKADTLGIGEENKLTDVEVKYKDSVIIPLKDVPAGRYMLTLKGKGFTPIANYTMVKAGDQSFYIYRTINGGGNGENTGIIEIAEGVEEITLSSRGTGFVCDLTLEKYDVKIAEAKTNYYVPVTTDGAKVAIDTATFAGTKVNIHIAIITTNITTVPTVTVKNLDGSIIGEGVASISLAILGDISNGAEYLTFETSGIGFTAMVWLEILSGSSSSRLEREIEFTALGGADFGYVTVMFTAGEAGDYVLTLSKHEDMSVGVVTVGVVYDDDPTKYIFNAMDGMMAPDVESKSATLSLEAGETIILRVYVFTHLNMTTFQDEITFPFKCNLSIEKAAGGLEKEIEFTALGGADFGYVTVMFTAGEAGDYVLTLSKHEEMSVGVVTVGVVYDDDPTKYIFNAMDGMMAPDVESKSATLSLEAGETIILRVYVFTHLNMATFQDEITFPFKCNLTIEKA